MSELPPELADMGEFDEGDNEISRHNSRDSSRVTRLIFGAMLAANTFGLLFLGFKFLGDSQPPVWVDDIRANTQRIEEMESTIATVKNLRSTLDELAENIEQAKKTLRAERTEDIAGLNFRINSLDERMDAYDEKLASLMLIKATQNKVVNSPKPTPKRPEQLAEIKMQLISLRSAGGYELVSLVNLKGEQSPLLRNGDVWQGWEFVRAENRAGTFRVNGREVTLVL